MVLSDFGYIVSLFAKIVNMCRVFIWPTRKDSNLSSPRLRRGSVEIATKKEVRRVLPGDLTKGLGLTNRATEKPPHKAGAFLLAYPKGFEPSTFRVGV